MQTVHSYHLCHHLAEEWVFHGCAGDTINLIVTEGFKVGGVDEGVPVRNGASCGSGRLNLRCQSLKKQNLPKRKFVVMFL